MSETTTVRVHNIDIGSIAKQFNSKAGFRNDAWNGHIDAALNGIQESKPDIVDGLEQLQPKIGRGNSALGQDGPTDVIWIISLVFITRTIGILGSKGSDERRSEENRKEHARLLERYLEDINTIISQKENCAALFSSN
jgi:hypothetical protein